MTFIHWTIRSRYGKSKSDLFWPSTISQKKLQKRCNCLQKENSKYILHFGSQKLINLDQNLIKNSIINLITNAIKYSEILQISILLLKLMIPTVLKYKMKG
jgi:K+-sensing histidine kinase KdpD